MLKVLLIIAAIAAYVLTTHPFDTPQSYCHRLYADGKSTPQWAINERDFFDYDSCVVWWRKTKENAGP